MHLARNYYWCVYYTFPWLEADKMEMAIITWLSESGVKLFYVPGQWTAVILDIEYHIYA